MPFVSIIVEFLRARPRGVFWTATLAQAALWLLVPVLFYASPPGDLPELLSIGREWHLGSHAGPPLSAWLAEAAFRAAGHRIFGVYLLSQFCVIGAFWFVFALARSLAGTHHAALAVLLMGGILVLSFPTPEFGAAILAMPLVAAALLFCWRAVAERRRNYWLALAFTLGLLLLTTYWALLVVALMAGFTIATREGRAALRLIDPYAALVLALLIPFPHVVWLWESGAPVALAAGATDSLAARLAWWPLLLLIAIAVHVGLGLLAVIASGVGEPRLQPVPEINGPAPPSLARRFVFFFALAPVLTGTLLASLLNVGWSPAWCAPAVLLSGAALVVWAGRRVRLFRQHVVGSVWLVLLLTPALAAIAAMLIVPWTLAFELSTQQPAAAMARFFTETYRRRTGQPLLSIAGDARLAEIIALASSDRPRVFAAEQPERTPWITEDDVLRTGGVVVWHFRDATGQAPQSIRARFPEMIPEVPQTFARPVQGIMPTLRIGWGLIRPAQ
jgi:4-amino-4-deoxy-L-arabinose transferase-like glycosyltransferase